MRKGKLLSLLIMFICMIVLFLIMGDILALSDIYDDYASRELLDLLKIDVTELPEWTNAKLEWTYIRISLLAKVLLVGLVVYLVRRNYRKVSESD